MGCLFQWETHTILYYSFHRVSYTPLLFECSTTQDYGLSTTVSNSLISFMLSESVMDNWFVRIVRKGLHFISGLLVL